MEEKEIWKDIEGFEGLYQVSNMGRVKSLNYRRTGKEGILKPLNDGRCYQQVKLWKDGKKKWYKIHRLVAQAFLDNSENLPEVNHLDQDKTNNKVENLEWCTSKQNCNYGTRNERMAEKHCKPVIAIHKVSGLILEFTSAREAERMTGIYHSSITRCCQGKQKTAKGYTFFYANANDDDTE